MIHGIEVWDFGNWNKERKNVERESETNIYQK